MKRKTIDSYFAKVNSTTQTNVDDTNLNNEDNTNPNQDTGPTIDVNMGTSSQIPNEQPSLNPRIETTISVGSTTLIRDLALRKPISSYPSEEQEEIVRAYNHIKFLYLNFLLLDPLEKSGSDAFTVQGFQNWKKIGGKNCSFRTHVGKDTNSAHGYSVLCWNNMQNTKEHIDHAYEKATPKQIEDNRKRIKASIDVVRWLTFQNCAFRGHDESTNSKNQGNFLEMLKLLASYSKEVNDVVLDNAPQNAKYTSPDIQTEILHVFAQKVQKEIRREIGESRFCIIVDESRDISKREQMAIVIRFFDEYGFLCERFLELVHVKDTTSQTLKEEISAVLSNHELSIQNLRGQGYDGASNMRGEWNGLQALFLKDCRYAYYVHCLAHQLQLALIAVARELAEVHDFFKDLIFIVNTVSSSSKRHDELQERQVAELENLIEIEEVETGKD